jgi:DNA adenine methylase
MDTAKRILAEVAASGAALSLHGVDIKYKGPPGSLTPELRERLLRCKPDLLAALGAAATAGRPPPRGVELGGWSYIYHVGWHGGALGGKVIALDTETRPIEGHEVPELALVSVSTSADNVLITPDQLGAFLLAHRERHFVCHNASFDFWAVAEHLRHRGEGEALASWWQIAGDGRLHDTMIMDALVGLARRDAFPRPRDLGTVAAAYARVEIDKGDPHRLRYGELIGKDLATVERGFLDYAMKDAVATRLAYRGVRKAARACAERAGTAAEVTASYGLLGERVQVLAAIALAKITRNGIHLNLSQARAVEANLRDRLRQAVERLRGHPEAAGLFKVKGDGSPALTPSGVPCQADKRLRAILAEVAGQIARETGQDVVVKKTAKGALSAVASEWEGLAHLHPFLPDWLDLKEAEKLVQFFKHLREPTAHPNYCIMVRSGRTSASRPNIQQVPKQPGFREIFTASPGNLLLSVDYAYVELVTLAAELLKRYGRSTLAEVIRNGVDPHEYTAALLLGMPLEEFRRLAESDPERYKACRQRAKPVNFGVPVGMGAASLVRSASGTYGVTMTLAEAQVFRDKLVHEVYPELALYLAEDAMSNLARGLNAEVEACWSTLDFKGTRKGFIPGYTRRVVRGEKNRADGQPYNEDSLARTWNKLARLNKNPELVEVLAARVGSPGLAAKLFGAEVATLTGRVRGRVSFCQARNTPFQGLAADGAKLALWELTRAGYRVVGFVHDEVLVELPDRGGWVPLAEAEAVVKIMKRAMERLTGGVPVGCEFALSRRWSKSARAIVEGERLLAWEPPAVAAGAARLDDQAAEVVVARNEVTEPVTDVSAGEEGEAGDPPTAEEDDQPAAEVERAAAKPRRPGKLTGPLKWHGGKTHLAPKIVALFPKHIHYVEPYFGGGAVLLAKDLEGVSEVANDLNSGLTNFWSTLRDEASFERFRRMAEVTPLSEAAWQEAGARLADPDPVARAFAFFVHVRQSMAGRGDCFTPLSRNRTRRGMNEQASAWLNAIEGLPAVHARLLRVAVLNRPALRVLESEDGPGTLFYLDPPYLHETRASTGEYGEHEMTTADHLELLRAIKKCTGKVALSGYRSALYDAELAGWARHEFELANHAAGGKAKRRVVECLWTNY